LFVWEIVRADEEEEDDEELAIEPATAAVPSREGKKPTWGRPVVQVRSSVP
jgi:hypothetical protein